MFYADSRLYFRAPDLQLSARLRMEKGTGSKGRRRGKRGIQCWSRSGCVDKDRSR